jgi:RHS repeat-associated protein
VVALLDSTGGRRETIAYSAYGVPFGRPAADVDDSGVVDATDATAITAALGESLGDPSYSILADINLDGTVDSSDSTIHSGQSGYALGRGNLSRNPSLTGGVGSRLGYAGYAWEPSASRYHVRHRVLDPIRGRWSKRDPLGYVDAPTMYAYVSNRAMAAVDPLGLSRFEVVLPPDGGIPHSNPNAGPKYACAPYAEIGGSEQFQANPSCPIAGTTGSAQNPNNNSDYLGYDPLDCIPGNVKSIPQGIPSNADTDKCCQSECPRLSKNKTGAIGVTGCCGSTVVSCVFTYRTARWARYWGAEGMAVAAALICNELHERDHQPRHDCDQGSNVTYASDTYWRGTVRGGDYPGDECAARQAEYKCLETSKALCEIGADDVSDSDDCRRQIDMLKDDIVRRTAETYPWCKL